jgi:hypothetical protein
MNFGSDAIYGYKSNLIPFVWKSAGHSSVLYRRAFCRTLALRSAVCKIPESSGTTSFQHVDLISGWLRYLVLFTQPGLQSLRGPHLLKSVCLGESFLHLLVAPAQQDRRLTVNRPPSDFIDVNRERASPDTNFTSPCTSRNAP